MTDQYQIINNLTIGDTIPESVLSQSTSSESIDNKTVYYYQSSLNSEPHWIVLNSSNKLIQIETYISNDLRSSIQQEQTSLGPPEFLYTLNREEQLLGYPTQGISYLVYVRSNTIHRVRQYAKTTITEYVSTFEPQEKVLERENALYEKSLTDMLNISKQASTSTLVNQPTINILNQPIPYKTVLISGIIFIIFLVLLVGLILFRRKRILNNKTITTDK